MDTVHDFYGIRARLPHHLQRDRTSPIKPVEILVVLYAGDHPSDVTKAHGRTVAIGHDERSVGLGGGELPVGLHGESLMRSPECSGRQIGVVKGHYIEYLIQANTAVEE